MIVSALYSFLLDRFQATDFAGTLTINLLKASLTFSCAKEKKNLT